MESDSPQSKGGKARAIALSPEVRSEIARKAATTKWLREKNSDPTMARATHEGTLTLGDLKLRVAVLQDGTRLLISRAFLEALGRPWKGTYRRTERPNFIDARNLDPFISEELEAALDPIEYRELDGRRAIGYRAQLLTLVCDVYLEAKKAGKLTKNQEKIAARSKELSDALRFVGLIALIDEATGYQRERERDELQRILSAYISPELLPWTRRFPEEFYREMFRLWSWPWPVSISVLGPRGPRYAGKITKMTVYDKLPPGVIEEIERRNPHDAKWQRKDRNHQLLTTDIGQPHLEKQVAVVTNIMKVCDDKDEFMNKFERAFPGTFDKARQLSFLKALDGSNMNDNA